MLPGKWLKTPHGIQYEQVRGGKKQSLLVRFPQIEGDGKGE
jgi:hypothetical protein